MLDARVHIGICDGGYVLTCDGVLVADEDDDSAEIEVQAVQRVCTSERELLKHVGDYLFAYRAWEARMDGKEDSKLDDLPTAKPKRKH